jgi:hypothetical protein
MKPWMVFLLAMLLAGCASYGGAGLKPGEAGIEDVQRLMGPPAMRWQDADGSVQLAYPHGPAGYHTFMVKLGPDGRLQTIANVLDSKNFARIHVGMTKEQVLRALGPSPFGADYFAVRDELVWSWHFCSDIGTAARFMVLFDGTSGIVRGTMAQDEGGEMQVSCSR